MSTSASCDCDHCQGGDLPQTPFVSPRITHGMLLGEDDFRALTGYPRGKHLLHQAWLHGPGVVWGYPVTVRGTYEIEVGRGLAVDGAGRDMPHPTGTRKDLRTIIKGWQADGSLRAAEPGCDSETVHACVVARFDCCPTDPVPTTADPCDVTRTHDDYSRVVERARIEVRLGCCPDRLGDRYRRVRMLLGVLPLEAGAVADDVRAARTAVLAAGDRTAELHEQLWRLACEDGIEACPADPQDGWLPSEPDDAVVPLAQLCFTLTADDGCWTFEEPATVEPCIRTTLLPTDVLTALAAGLAPEVFGAAGSSTAGPQVDAAGMAFEDGRRTLVIPVTAPLLPGTVERNVEVTTLAQEDGAEWVVEDVYGARYDEARQAVRVRLAYSLDTRPDGALVRIRIRGTGSRPVMGADPRLPLHGVTGRPPGDPSDGRDAIWTIENDLEATGSDEQEVAR